MANYDKHNIAIISIYSFPSGLAPTNRILAYAKGMIANGSDITVYMPFPTDSFCSGDKLPNEGKFEDINYCYTSGRYKSESKILRGLAVLSGYRKIKGYITSYSRVKINAKKEPIDCLFISTDHIPTLFFYSFLAKINNVKSIFIFDEYPIPIRHKLKNRIPWWKELFFKVALLNINGYVSISENLKEYYNKLVPKKTLVLSLITDISRFDIPQIDNSIYPVKKYLCYMGNMELSKDNIDVIIKAFAKITKKHPDLELHLYGEPSNNTMELIIDLIHQLNLEEKAFIKGKANYNDVPIILKNAKVLVSSQPDTIRAGGGFPTKLGEYLTTGVPTLVTDVGENSKYVKNMEHIFFSKPGNSSEFAERLDFILNNYDLAINIAQNGKRFIVNNFSHVIQGYNLIEFCRTF